MVVEMVEMGETMLDLLELAAAEQVDIQETVEMVELIMVRVLLDLAVVLAVVAVLLERIITLDQVVEEQDFLEVLLMEQEERYMLEEAVDQAVVLKGYLPLQFKITLVEWVVSMAAAAAGEAETLVAKP
jgi:hypothetical protein